MLSVLVFLPLTVAAVLVHPRVSDTLARAIFVAVSAVEVALVALVWASYETPELGAWPTRSGRSGSRGWAPAITSASTDSPCRWW